MSRGLREILAKPESFERTAALVEWIQGLFDERPILVGGAAVELYTRGAYTTSDLDFVGSVPSVVADALEKEGFRRRGRHWVHEEDQVFVELPGRELADGEESVELELGGRRVVVIAPEPLIVDRLAAWQFWASEQDAVNALLVSRSVSVDRALLTRLAEIRQVLPALESLRQATNRWSAREPDPEELREWASRIPAE